jgi:aryl-phospho-beta-D-glucosidase BglC (GH1 family)
VRSRGVRWSVLSFVFLPSLAIRAYDGSITLETAGSYAVLADSTVSNTGPSVLNGNLSVSPNSPGRATPPVAVPAPVPHPEAIPIGINMSEAEYSWGSFPEKSDLAYIKKNRIGLIRVPIAWERAQAKLCGSLDSTYLSRLKAFIRAANTQGMQVIVDLHNYGRYNSRWSQQVALGYVAPNSGDVIGSGTVPISAFVDLWTRLAAALKGTPGLDYYDIMNEPYSMGGTNVWPSAAQAAVNAIRTVDMDPTILVEGTQWASARWWLRDNGTLHVTDPANKLLYEAHLYFDSDGSGTYSQTYAQSGAYPNVGIDRLQPFLTWLKQNNAKGFLGEFGIPNSDPQWLPVLDNFLTALQAAGLSGTYWNYAFHSPSDPSWWPVNDPTSIINDGRANPQMAILLKHNGALDSYRCSNRSRRHCSIT